MLLIRIQAGLTRFALAPALALLPALSFSANVTIDASHTGCVVADTAYGIHTSVYDNINGNSALPGMLKESGVSTLRYPGGGYADAFHWSVSRPALDYGNVFFRLVRPQPFKTFLVPKATP